MLKSNAQLQGVQVWNVDSFLKKYVKLGTMIKVLYSKYALSFVTHFLNTT